MPISWWQQRKGNYLRYNLDNYSWFAFKKSCSDFYVFSIPKKQSSLWPDWLKKLNFLHQTKDKVHTVCLCLTMKIHCRIQNDAMWSMYNPDCAHPFIMLDHWPWLRWDFTWLLRISRFLRAAALSTIPSDTQESRWNELHGVQDQNTAVQS